MSSLFYEPFYEFERLIGDSLSNRLLPADTGSQQVQRVGGGDTGRALRPRRVSAVTEAHTCTNQGCSMDLHEDVQKNVVTATFELPGLKKEDVNIDIHNNRLTVTGESKMSQDYDERGWAICERRYGKFSRTLQLPQGVKVCRRLCVSFEISDVIVSILRTMRSRPKWTMAYSWLRSPRPLQKMLPRRSRSTNQDP